MRPFGSRSPESSHPREDKNIPGKGKDTEVLDSSLNLFAGSTSVSQNPKLSAPEVKPHSCALYYQLAMHFVQSDWTRAAGWEDGMDGLSSCRPTQEYDSVRLLCV